MSDLDRESDADLPPVGSDLGRWRFFAFINLDAPHFAYLDLLCDKFGPDWVVEQSPELFLDHVARVAFTNDREAA